jgi:glutathione S-transferase
LGKTYLGTEPTEEQLTSFKNSLKLLDTMIGSNGFVAANHMTIADLSLLSSSTIFSYVNYDLSDYPNVKQWYEKLQNDLPYFKEVNERAKKAMDERIRNAKANK